MIAVRKSIGDCPEHADLFRSLLKRLKIPRERPAILEDGCDLVHVERDRVFRIIERRIFGLIEPGAGVFFLDPLRLDSLAAVALQNLLEQPGGIPGQRLTQADELVHQLHRQFARHLEQAVEGSHRYLCIVQGAMSGR